MAVAPTRPAYRRRATMSATDEFWFSPTSHELPSSSSPAASDCGCGESSTSPSHVDLERSDSASSSDSLTMTLPAPHAQLLSDESVSYRPLTGYDHTASSSSSDACGEYDFSDDDHEGCAALDAPVCRRRFSAVKREGGGSWLLGFARLGGASPSLSAEGEDEESEPAPGLVREESDDSSSSDESSCSDDDDSASEPEPAPQAPKKRAGVSFAAEVAVRPIPHSDSLSPAQRRRMYSTTVEVRQNKTRNKREYRYDGCDWRNATEEWEMGVDMVTGELVHPAHEAHLRRGMA